MSRDDFHEPEAHVAPLKSVISAVLSAAAVVGDSLVSLLSGLLASALILYSGLVLYDTLYTQNNAFSSSWDVMKYQPEVIDPGVDPIDGQNELQRILQDYRAWLTMYETNINYPVVQGPNDLYYASHDIYGNASLTGAIYLAAGNTADMSDVYNLIYGHHMDNGAMFGGLDHYLDLDYLNAHKEGILVTPVGVWDLEVFAVIETDAYESKVYGVGPSRTVEDVLDFLTHPTDKTTVRYYDADAVEGATKITALSTCASAETNGRLVVFCTTTLRNLITVELADYSGIFDGRSHRSEPVMNYPDGTRVEYSTDGGQTWTQTPPTITDVGMLEVTVRVTNDVYGRAIDTATYTVGYAPVTVTAVEDGKTYGTPDPEFNAVVRGVVENDTFRIQYTVTRPGAGTDEDVDRYTNALVPSGETYQGNYVVTYIPADFIIEPAPMIVWAIDYIGEYDGALHWGDGDASVPVSQGTVIEFRYTEIPLDNPNEHLQNGSASGVTQLGTSRSGQTSGGVTRLGGASSQSGGVRYVDDDEGWVSDPPAVLNVGSWNFEVRAKNRNYVTAYDSGVLIVTPRQVTVKANPASKQYGASDPTFSATVTGTLNNDTVIYTVTRPGVGVDEAIGTYPDAIIAAGEAEQGNYVVSYEPADFTITRSGELTVTGTGYNGPYDGTSHTGSAVTNIPLGTTIMFSEDGGTTWTADCPTITNVGTKTVLVRAQNDFYYDAFTTITLKVTPIPAYVTAVNSSKVYGDPDPVFTATVSGVIDGFEIVYQVHREGNDENVGHYDDVIVPYGEIYQGNYEVTYIPADFEITSSGELVLFTTDYNGTYDATEHFAQASVNEPNGTVIEYSTDGEHWTTEVPSITNVGSQTYQVRAVNPDYITVYGTVTLTVRPAEVIVRAINNAKVYGQADPTFEAQVFGVFDGYEIQYTVGRPRAGLDEDAGFYPESILPEGEKYQGNYEVTYVPADFTITKAGGLTVDATGYNGPYDAETHAASATANVSEGTVIYYEVNGEWTTTPPTVTNVDESATYWVKAENPNYETAYTTVTLQLTRLALVVRAEEKSKTYGSADPVFTAVVEGNIVDGFEPVYTVTRPGAGTDEAVGTYTDAIIADGEAVQGNYTVSYVPADFTITANNELALVIRDYSGEYDGESHQGEVETNIPDGTTIEYYVNGEWTQTPPTITDVGSETYPVRATNPNYETVTGEITLTVTPKTVTVTAQDSRKIYGREDPVFRAEVEGLLPGDSIVFTVTRPGAGTDENVGTYEDAIVPAGDEYQGNYHIVYVPADFDINRSDALTVSATDYSGVYDAQSHAAVVTADPLPGTTIEYYVNGEWTQTAPTIKDVGSETYLVRATNPNYYTVYTEVTLTVTMLEVTVTARNAGKAYGQPDPEFFADVIGVIDDYEIVYTVSRIRAGIDENVGVYENVIVPAGEEYQGNYHVTYIPAGFFIITSADELIVIPTNYEGVYDAQSHTAQATANIPEGTTIEYFVDGAWTTTPPSITDVGTLTVPVRATNPNYEPAEGTLTLTVQPREAVVTAKDASKSYGAADPLFEAEVTGVIDDFVIVYEVSRPGAGTDEEVGVYVDAIVPTGAETQGNYHVTYVPADFEITSSGILMVIPTDYAGVYDGQSHEATATANVTEGTVIEYLVLGEWTTTPPTITDVGSREVRVRATNPNYETAYGMVTLTVTRRPVTVTAQPAAKTYGEADPTFSAVVSGVVDNFTIQYEVSRPGAGTDEAVGTYPGAIIPTGEAEQGNYSVTYIAADFEITAAGTLEIRAVDYEGVYDAQSHEAYAYATVGEGTVIEYLVDGEWTTTPPSITDTDSKTYEVRATNPNYETVYTTVTLTVHRAPVVVTALRSSKVYGDPDPAFSATVSGVIDDFVIVYEVSRPGAGTDENVGVYTDAIIPTGAAEQGNYSVTYVPAEFEITRSGALTVTGIGYEGPYDGETHEGSATTNIPEGTTIEYYVNGEWTTEAPSIKDVGSVTVPVRATNPNYETVYDSLTLTVTALTVIVRAQDSSKYFGEADPAFTATVEGVIDDTVIVFTVSRPGAGTDENVGVYEDAIIPAGAERQGNYLVTYIPADFEIFKGEGLRVYANGYEGVYDGESHEASATTNIPDGTVIEYLVNGEWTTTPPSITDVGDHTYDVRATNPNYETVVTTVTLTVHPARVTVTAQDNSKMYGTADPTFTAVVEGVVDDFEIQYIVTRPGVGTDENVGTYEDAIVPSGETYQGNYEVVYIPADFEILPSDQLSVSATGYEGVYDASSHSASALANVQEGTVIEYLVNGEWTTTPPSIEDVGSHTYDVRATNPNYQTVYTTVTLTVSPAQVIVQANNAGKVYGTPDPEFTATVSGVIDDFVIVYSVARVGNDENVGTYEDVIVPSGEERQGNYTVIYLPADFTITASGELVVIGTGYEGVYDAASHEASAVANITEGTVIEWFVNGEWTTTPPSITNVGSETYQVRATNPNYQTAYDTVTLTVSPRPVTVTARDASKYYGNPDPTFQADVSGVIDDYVIEYTLSRPGAGTDENVGIYEDAIIPAGETYQGNYVVTYIPADFEILRSGELTVIGTGYEGVYDAQSHEGSATANITEGTVIEYYVNGEWTTTPPSITDVGSFTVQVRATNPNYETAYDTLVLTVTPRPVTVTAADSSKVFGDPDPEFSATVSGVIDDFTIVYTVGRVGGNEDVGTYDDVIVPTGEERQGNYIVTYVPADFTITASGGLRVIGTGYDDIYDAQSHSASAVANITQGTVIEWFVNGEWTTTPPSITDVGTFTVQVRATNPNYDTAYDTVTLTVRPRPVTVTAANSSKIFGFADPAFTATVSGVIDGYEIVYTVSRPRAGVDEAVGVYEGAIIPTGEEIQGNYIVTYVPGTFEITASGALIITPVHYEGVYDAASHEGLATVNIPNGTLIEYSEDGVNWTTTPPSITDVGERDVFARATNPNYETAVTQIHLKVTPVPVVVTAAEAAKRFGEEDPEFKATVTGVIDDFEIVYTVGRPGAGTDEEVGTYEDAIVPEGEEIQGNYIVTYVPADFTITNGVLTLSAHGYTGVYDAEEHFASASASIMEDTVIEFSKDGGLTWTEEIPSIINAGTQVYLVRATNPNYEPVQTEIRLTVTRLRVSVTADPAEKKEGEDDPEFSAVVEGVIDGYEIQYTVSRPGAGRDEAPGTYERAIEPTGAEVQGNYLVSYFPAAFTIIGETAPSDPSKEPTEPSTDPEIIDDEDIPLINRFNPKGTPRAAWALVNLICVFCTAYLLLPLLHLGDKFGRKKLMKKLNGMKAELREKQELEEQESEEKLRINLLAAIKKASMEENATPESIQFSVASMESFGFDQITVDEFGEAVDELYYRIREFKKRLTWGVIAEILTTIGAIIAFILTEDMRNPMILIDRWTPLMLLILLVTWIVDLRLARYRAGVEAEKEQKDEAEDVPEGEEAPADGAGQPADNTQAPADGTKT